MYAHIYNTHLGTVACTHTRKYVHYIAIYFICLIISTATAAKVNIFWNLLFCQIFSCLVYDVKFYDLNMILLFCNTLAN